GTGTFTPTWHTMDDNIKNIDRSSLKAAGQTVLNVIFNEIRCIQ
ncbi:MAG: M28 family peptidase, partial [Duncaniella sp.]|nr:M28 family peptidase [Duncaniella sp.]